MVLTNKKDRHELYILFFVFNVYLQNLSPNLVLSLHFDPIFRNIPNNLPFDTLYKHIKIYVHAKIHISPLRDNTTTLSSCF